MTAMRRNTVIAAALATTAVLALLAKWERTPGSESVTAVVGESSIPIEPPLTESVTKPEEPSERRASDDQLLLPPFYDTASNPRELFDGNFRRTEEQLASFRPIYFKIFRHPNGEQVFVRFRLMPQIIYSEEFIDRSSDPNPNGLIDMARDGDPNAALSALNRASKCRSDPECQTFSETDELELFELVKRNAGLGDINSLLSIATTTEGVDPSEAATLYTELWSLGYVEGLFGLSRLSQTEVAQNPRTPVERFATQYAALAISIAFHDGLHPGSFLTERRNEDVARLEQLFLEFPPYIHDDAIQRATDLINDNPSCCYMK